MRELPRYMWFVTYHNSRNDYINKYLYSFFVVVVVLCCFVLLVCFRIFVCLIFFIEHKISRLSLKLKRSIKVIRHKYFVPLSFLQLKKKNELMGMAKCFREYFCTFRNMYCAINVLQLFFFTSKIMIQTCLKPYQYLSHCFIRNYSKKNEQGSENPQPVYSYFKLRPIPNEFTFKDLKKSQKNLVCGIFFLTAIKNEN